MGEKAGTDTWFVWRIWNGFEIDKNRGRMSLMLRVIAFIIKCSAYSLKYEELFSRFWTPSVKPNTKRMVQGIVKGERFKVGDTIKICVKNGKKRLQVVPKMEIKSVRPFSVEHSLTYRRRVLFGPHYVWVAVRIENETFQFENTRISPKGDECSDISGLEKLQQFTQDCGFDSMHDFLLYFNKDFKGQVVRWEGLKY